MQRRMIGSLAIAALLGTASAASAAAPAAPGVAPAAAKLSLDARATARTGKKSRQNAAAIGIPLAIAAVVVGIAVSDSSGGDSN